MIELYEGFVWERATGGHRCVTVGKRQILTNGVALGAEREVERYLPLAKEATKRTGERRPFTGLHRTFADVEPTPEGIVRFADEYGMLTHGENLAGSAYWGEPLTLWREQVFAMRRCLRLWDAVRGDDAETLARHVRWHHRHDADAGASWDEVSVVSHEAPPAPALGVEPYERWTMSPLVSPDLFVQGGWQAGELVRPAMEYVRRKLNAALEGRAIPNETVPRRSGQPTPPSATVTGGAAVEMLWPDSATTMRLGLFVIPRDLLSGLWLQFASAIATNASFRRCECEGCGRWFQTAGKSRTDRVFCRESCRQSAHRQRVRRACTLKAGGMSLKDIAAELGTDVKTVRGWTKTKPTK